MVGKLENSERIWLVRYKFSVAPLRSGSSSLHGGDPAGPAFMSCDLSAALLGKAMIVCIWGMTGFTGLEQVDFPSSPLLDGLRESGGAR